MHFTINQINSIASNNNECLPEDQCTVHKQTNVYSLKSSCVVYQRTQHSPLYWFKEMYDVIMMMAWGSSNEGFSYWK